MAAATPDEVIAPNDGQNGATSPQANESSPSPTSPPAQAATSAEATNITTNDDDDIRELKLAWLRRLPFEQVLAIVLKLDDFASEEAKSAVWPTDLKAATTETQPAETTDAVVESNSEQPVELQVKSDSSTTDAQQQALLHPPPPDALPGASSPPPGFAVPPMAGLQPPPPPPPGAGPPPPPIPPPGFPYPYGPYAPYAHAYAAAAAAAAGVPGSSTHPHHAPFTSSPLFNPSLLAGGGVAGKNGQGDEEATLPSYEEMLTNALTVLCDPNGEAPRNLFAWMAAHYPVQSNFRPSASQALQKAYKRGRFLKTKNGKYKLNPSWDGGNFIQPTRRTTRRPMYTYRPPMLPFPPYAQPPVDGLPPPGFPPPPGTQPPSAGDADATTAAADNELSTTSEPAPTHIDAWEAAQNILQELNRQALKRLGEETPAPESSSNSGAVPASESATSPPEGAEDQPTAGPSTVADKPDPPLPAFPMPIIAGSVDLDLTRKDAPSINEVSSSTKPSRPSDSSSGGRPPQTGRAALQSHLVLLATQLADFAGSSNLLVTASSASS